MLLSLCTLSAPRYDQHHVQDTEFYRIIVGKKDVFRDQKEGGGGGGYYWPVPAVWRSGGEDPEFHQNGVYLSHLAAMVFTGKKIATKARVTLRACEPVTGSASVPPLWSMRRVTVTTPLHLRSLSPGPETRRVVADEFLHDHKAGCVQAMHSQADDGSGTIIQLEARIQQHC